MSEHVTTFKTNTLHDSPFESQEKKTRKAQSIELVSKPQVGGVFEAKKNAIFSESLFRCNSEERANIFAISVVPTLFFHQHRWVHLKCIYNMSAIS